MQFNSDIKAQVEVLSERVGGVEGVIEGITETFAARLLEAAGALQKTEALEERMRTASAKLGGLLEEATARLNGSFETHHARNSASKNTMGRYDTGLSPQNHLTVFDKIPRAVEF